MIDRCRDVIKNVWLIDTPEAICQLEWIMPYSSPLGIGLPLSMTVTTLWF